MLTSGLRRIAELLLLIGMLSGHKPVERHRDVDDHVRHCRLPLSTVANGITAFIRFRTQDWCRSASAAAPDRRSRHQLTLLRMCRHEPTPRKKWHGVARVWHDGRLA